MTGSAPSLLFHKCIQYPSACKFPPTLIVFKNIGVNFICNRYVSRPLQLSILFYTKKSAIKNIINTIYINNYKQPTVGVAFQQLFTHKY